MSAPVPSTRRLAVAIGAAATSATIAIGVTAASLLGWFSPADVATEAPPIASPVILVPITPTPAAPSARADDVQLAMIDRDREPASHDDDDDDHEDDDHDDDRDDDHDDDGEASDDD